MLCARHSLRTATLAAVLLSSLTAGAQEQERFEQHWYGWQNLIGLGAAYSLIGAGLSVDSGTAPLVAAGLGTYVLSGPIIHLAHGNGFGAGVSTGLNLGLPLTTGVIGALTVCGIGNCKGYMGGLGYVVGGLFGGALGMIAANVIDVAFLAVEKVERPSPAAMSPLDPEAARYRPIFQVGFTF
ncbi:hypothetical protein [Chondromyces crocatus]|uniref:Uncharacterized protein n=1 Tax=Chondromyces crocatus TaxID=52 RepID=A0A0K1EM36_CHOCO|nr:hypothetical protein [Chondromyces crocatus]AKT41929.1 uncharacterized protein CMC5_061510 [Chondromyces crocatus]